MIVTNLINPIVAIEYFSQKKKITEETISRSVNHGKFLSLVKSQRMEEIEKNFRDIQERITSEIDEVGTQFWNEIDKRPVS